MAERCPCTPCAMGTPNHCSGPHAEEVQAAYWTKRRTVVREVKSLLTDLSKHGESEGRELAGSQRASERIGDFVVSFANGSTGITYTTAKLKFAIELAGQAVSVKIWSAIQDWARELRAEWRRQEAVELSEMADAVSHAATLADASSAVAAFVERRRRTHPEHVLSNSEAKHE